MALDLNGFKAVNDTHGHAAGDRLLAFVATKLSETAGDKATVVRQGGDEFCILLPDSGPRRAQRVAERIRAALAPSVRTGIGVATYPVDGGDPLRLVELADARLTAEKAARRGAPAPKLGWLLDGDGVALPASTLHQSGGTDHQGSEASRAAIGASRVIWRTTGGMFSFYALFGIAVFAVRPALTGPLYVPVMATALIIGVAVLCTSPPALHSRRSEIVLASSYILPALLFVDAGSHPSVAVGAAVFIGPLVAVRTQTRRRAGTHIALATLLLAVAVVATGAGFAAIIAVTILIATMNVLALCCVFVLEASEAQGVELAKLAVTDPLTRLANRRQLLAAAEQAVSADGARVVALALDLNGFKTLNDVAGHGAGDDLLIAVADILRELAPSGATIARPGGEVDDSRRRSADRASP